jgi:hypothetical protein
VNVGREGGEPLGERGAANAQCGRPRVGRGAIGRDDVHDAAFGQAEASGRIDDMAAAQQEIVGVNGHGTTFASVMPMPRAVSGR